jgi:hypothetical protein
MMQKLNERTVTGPNVLRCGGVPAAAKAREAGIINAGRIKYPDIIGRQHIAKHSSL